MRLILLTFLSLVSYMKVYSQVEIHYSTEISDRIVTINTKLNSYKWVKDSFLNIKDSYYNNELDLRLIFNKQLINASSDLNIVNQKLNYLIENFNSEYSINDAYFTYNTRNGVYKCFYDDKENSFIIYTYFFENYIIYASFYCKIKTDVNSFENDNYISILDKMFFNSKLDVK